MPRLPQLRAPAGEAAAERTRLLADSHRSAPDLCVA
jgi:hypothetical protein